MHSFSDFLKACAVPGAVVVTKSALDTVEQLGLSPTGDAVLEWILAGGIVNPQHLNTEPWRNNPDPEWKSRKSVDTVIWVDAFTCESGEDEVYFAYFFQPKTGKWMLKSMKPRS